MCDLKTFWAKLGLCLITLSLAFQVTAEPRVKSISTVNLSEDYCQWISYTLSDPEFEYNFMLLSVTAHSSNPELVPDDNLYVIRAGYSGLISLVPLTNAFGAVTITITVSNPNGESSSTNFTYFVEPVNDQPTLSILPDMALTANAGVQTVPLSGITTGATNEPQDLVVKAFANPPGILTNLQISYTSPDASGVLSFETVSNVTGKAVVDVFVDDGASEYYFVRRSFVVQVNPSNMPPTISAVADQMTDLDVSKLVSFTVGDKETASETLVMEAASSNPALVPSGNVVFGGSGSNRTAAITSVAGQSGVAQITFTVSDAQGGHAAATFVYTVRPDGVKPVVSARPLDQTLATGATLRLSAAVLGEEPLTYQWQRNGSDVFTQTNATLEITNAQSSDAGAYTLVASNLQGSVTSLAAQVRVLPSFSGAQITRSKTGAVLSLNTTLGLTYTVEYVYSFNAPVWNVLEVVAGTGGTVVVADPGSKWETRFYRVRVD
jgi:hypothetical protein